MDSGNNNYSINIISNTPHRLTLQSFLPSPSNSIWEGGRPPTIGIVLDFNEMAIICIVSPGTNTEIEVELVFSILSLEETSYPEGLLTINWSYSGSSSEPVLNCTIEGVNGITYDYSDASQETFCTFSGAASALGNGYTISILNSSEDTLKVHTFELTTGDSIWTNQPILNQQIPPSDSSPVTWTNVGDDANANLGGSIIYGILGAGGILTVTWTWNNTGLPIGSAIVTGTDGITAVSTQLNVGHPHVTLQIVVNTPSEFGSSEASTHKLA